MKDYYVFFSESYLEYPSDSGDVAVVCAISGCKHNCPGCHSPITQQFVHKNVNNVPNNLELIEIDKWYKFTGESKDISDQIIKIINNLTNNMMTKECVISGGDPLYHSDLVKDIIKNLSNDLKVCIYTGMTIDQVKDIWLQTDSIEYWTNLPIFNNLIFKCGTFKQELYQEPDKTDDFIRLASTNQDFYNSNFNKLSENGILYFNKLQQ